MTAADVGHALTVLGSCWTAAWLVGDAARGWTVIRCVGRRALRVARWRPRVPRVTVTVDDVGLMLRRDALARYDRTDRRRACARRGHQVDWDGLYESCRRCDATPPPGSVLLDDPIRTLPPPHPYP